MKPSALIQPNVCYETATFFALRQQAKSIKPIPISAAFMKIALRKTELVSVKKFTLFERQRVREF